MTQSEIRHRIHSSLESWPIGRRAFMYACIAHQGQTRADGHTPYIIHPIEVWSELSKSGESSGIVECVAYLHDVVEDTDIEIDEIQYLFGDRVAYGVYNLTRHDGMSHEDYFRRLKSCESWVKKVKVADRVCNLRNLKLGDDQEWYRKYCEKTVAYFDDSWISDVGEYLLDQLEVQMKPYKESAIS